MVKLKIKLNKVVRRKENVMVKNKKIKEAAVVFRPRYKEKVKRQNNKINSKKEKIERYSKDR